MRSRAPVALLASLAACAMAPSAALASDNLLPYSAEVTATEAATLEAGGFDMHEGGFDHSKLGAQKVEFAATEKQIAKLAQSGIEAERLALDAPTP